MNRPIQQTHVCITSLDEDFIIHARDQAAPGKALEDTLIRFFSPPPYTKKSLIDMRGQI